LLNHLTKAVGGELLENVPDFPFAGGNPLPVRRFIHGPQGRVQRALASLSQLPLEDFLVHNRPPLMSYLNYHTAGLPKKMATPSIHDRDNRS
jgi:hypothetical protein